MYDVWFALNTFAHFLRVKKKFTVGYYGGTACTPCKSKVTPRQETQIPKYRRCPSTQRGLLSLPGSARCWWFPSRQSSPRWRWLSGTEKDFGDLLGKIWSLFGALSQRIFMHFHHFLGSVVLSLIRRRNCSQEFTERIPSENIWKPGRIAKLSKCSKQGTTCRNPLAARLIINAVGWCRSSLNRNRSPRNEKRKKLFEPACRSTWSTSPKGIAGWFWVYVGWFWSLFDSGIGQKLQLFSIVLPNCAQNISQPICSHVFIIPAQYPARDPRPADGEWWLDLQISSASMATCPTNMGASPSTHGF